MFKQDFYGGTAFKNRVVKDGLVDLKGLHKEISGWIKENKYDFTLKENQSKTKPQGAEINLGYGGEKKIDDYCMLSVEVKILIRNSKKTKVNNKEVDRCHFEAWVESKMALDYRDEYKRTSFGKFLAYIYHNYFIRRKIFNYYFGKSYVEGMDLHKTIKEFLDLYS